MTDDGLLLMIMGIYYLFTTRGRGLARLQIGSIEVRVYALEMECHCSSSPFEVDGNDAAISTPSPQRSDLPATPER